MWNNNKNNERRGILFHISPNIQLFYIPFSSFYTLIKPNETKWADRNGQKNKETQIKWQEFK